MRRGSFPLLRKTRGLGVYPMLLGIVGELWVGLGYSEGVSGGVGRIRFLVVSLARRWGTYDDDSQELLLIGYHNSRSLLWCSNLSA